MNCYNNNIECLKKHNIALYDKIKNTHINYDNYEIVICKNGFTTLKVIKHNNILLHSKYNPEKEAEVFANSKFKKKKKVNILYGFGLGYHIKKILSNLGEEELLYVLDSNIELFKIALEICDLCDVLLDKRLILTISDDVKRVNEILGQLLKKDCNFTMYLPSVRIINEKYKDFKLTLEIYNARKNSIEKFTDIINQNYSKNKLLNNKNIGILFNKYKDMPVIIVSAGPSLNINKHILKKMLGKALIIAVGSALQPLLRCDVKPNMFCIIDPQPITYKQIEGCENLDIPFIYLDTASSYTVSRYNGPKYVASNDTNHLKDNTYLIESGGSVATVVLDIAVKLGGNPIVFVGQDLAYIDNKHHADGKMYDGEENVKYTSNMRKIKGQNGGILYTTLGLLSFKKWIENKIIKNSHIEFINCSEGGAIIDGCKHMKLKDLPVYLRLN